MRKDIEKLVRAIEPQVISILIAKNYIHPGAKKFTEMKATQKGKSVIGGDLFITKEWITKWRLLWPKGLRGTNTTVREKISLFLMEFNTDLEEVMEFTKMFLSEKEAPYCGNANNFFYMSKGKHVESRAEEYLELYRESIQKVDNINETFMIEDEDY